MNRVKVFLMILVCTLSVSACFYRIPTSIKNSFTYCYSNKYTGIDTLVNIDGYYKETRLYKRSPIVGGFLKDTSTYYIDTAYFYFMFYDNGILVYNIRDAYYDEKKKEFVKKDAVLFLKDFAENSEDPGANYFYHYFWGGYIISGDTIKTQIIGQGRSLNAGWSLREDWYKIIDRNTIQRINAFNFTQDLNNEKYSLDNRNNIRECHFHLLSCFHIL